MRIETVTIHHLGLQAESQVPSETVASWAAHGWIEGPFPSPDERPAKNAGKPVWRAYAESLGIELDAAATRDEIIEAVDEFEEAPPETIASRQPDDSEPSPVGETPTTLKEGQQ